MKSVSEADLTILYGSQTGNAEFLAYGISESAPAAGLSAELLSLEDALQGDNLLWRRLLVVTSTHDDGHMPDNAESFWNWLESRSANQYAGLPYAVLALGDSMYEDFCKAGKDFLHRFSELGAVPMIDHVECDVDFDLTAAPWIKRMLAAAAAADPWEPVEQPETPDDAATEQFLSAPEEWHDARITDVRRLTSADSAKRVIHVEIELPDGFAYTPGDSLDIVPRNHTGLVEEWLKAFPDADTVHLDGNEIPLRTALIEHLEIRLPHIGLINSLITTIPSSESADRIRNLLDSGDRQAIGAWLWGKDVLDVVCELGFAGTDVQPIIELLRPIQVRSYSISSSPRRSKAGLSLTVSAISYDSSGRSHVGAGTSYLESRIGEHVRVRRARSHGFQLPEGDAPVIMIGPGVGVAPFIGFLEELEQRGSGNKSWLFFGDQRRQCDWLYEDEMQRWLDSGTLSRLSLAFSRDQPEKHYVQHEMRAEAAQLRSWIDAGAHVYLCGDKGQMAHDVEEALAEVLSMPLEQLRDAGRYAKDVY